METGNLTSFKRFATATAADIAKVKEERHEQGTNVQTTWAVKVFRDWLLEKKRDEQGGAEFESFSKEYLNDLLSQFYLEVRRQDGRSYSKIGLSAIRSGLARHLCRFNNRSEYLISTDPAFTESNLVLEGVYKQMTREGLDVVNHFEAIEAKDMEKLMESGVIGTNNPLALQRLVWLNIALHFGRRGREWYRQMTKDTFVVGIDLEGKRYVEHAAYERTKIHQGEPPKAYKPPQGRMYEITGDEHCPLKAYELYLSRLNEDVHYLWQKPHKNYLTNGNWYCKSVLGVNTLGTMLKKMCEEAGITTRYTNHCTRLTTSVRLNEEGFSACDIIKVTDHKNTGSLRSYLNRVTPCMKKQMSSSIGQMIAKKTKVHLPAQRCASLKENVSPGPSYVNQLCSPDGQESVIHLEEVSSNNKSTSDDDDDDDDDDDLFMDIKIEEEEDPLDIPSTSDVPTSYNENILSKKPRLDNTVSNQMGLTEEVFIKTEEEEEASTTEKRPLAGSGRAKTYTGPKPQKSQTLRNSTTTTTTTTNSTTNKNESLKDVRLGSRDIYDVFGAHIAKTLRDINDESTFRQVKMKINDILLEALAGHYIAPPNPQTRIFLPVNTSPKFMILPGNSQNPGLGTNSQVIVLPSNSVLPPNNSVLPPNNSVLPNNSILPPNNSAVPNNSQTTKRHRVTRIFPNNSQSHMLPAGRGSPVLYLPMDPGQVVTQNQTPMDPGQVVAQNQIPMDPGQVVAQNHLPMDPGQVVAQNHLPMDPGQVVAQNHLPMDLGQVVAQNQIPMDPGQVAQNQTSEPAVVSDNNT